jgi:hypothetical protein
MLRPSRRLGFVCTHTHTVLSAVQYNWRLVDIAVRQVAQPATHTAFRLCALIQSVPVQTRSSLQHDTSSDASAAGPLAGVSVEAAILS